MLIIKFGGTSVANARRIEGVATIVERIRKNHKKVGVVVSAFGGVTDDLIRMSKLASRKNDEYISVYQEIRQRHIGIVKDLGLHRNKAVHQYLEEKFAALHDILHGVYLVRELSHRTLDFISGQGELLSACIIAHYLKSRKIAAEFLDARSIIRTDETFGAGKVNFPATNKNIKNYFTKAKGVTVITGFVSSTDKGEMTTLGRGGSDYTASIFGAALDAEEIQIWTDVDGVMTADPRKVRKAFSIAAMTYDEAMEMSHFGAKVIHPPTIQPALDKKIPLVIRNSFRPQHPGTFISAKTSDPAFLIKGISSIDNVALLTLQGSGMVGVAGISARLFNSLSQAKINVILITQGSSEHTISFAVRPDDAEAARWVIEEAFHLEIRAKMIDRIRLESNLSIIAVIGENMRNTPGVSGRLFQSLGKNGISVVATAQGSSELNISTVIHRHDLDKALNALHQAFFLSDVKTLSVFLIGTGLIGSTLIKQIATHRDHLRKARSLEIIVAGIANSRKMIFNGDGLSLSKYADLLTQSGSKMELQQYISTMNEMNLSQSIFVDCTSDQHVADSYPQILKHSISIVTPNKVANSGTFRQYNRLREQARKSNVRFMYETNVGAGLPVINTLNDLLSSGDRIIRIEAVLSGTLSFIFNNFVEGKSFCDIVQEARRRGYTEPDPRIDLSGKDVARKLLILAREAGNEMEINDIRIKQILPSSCMRAKTVDAFFTELKKNDAVFEKLRQKAASSGKVLRYIAKLEKGKASIQLEEVDSTHPFYNLSGSDNIISYTTERYHDRPLVVKGPGAGAEVTAAGVFAEIISIGKYFE